MRAPEKYALGIDFGTSSVRVSAVSLSSGRELATEVCGYRVIEASLPDGTPLKPRMSLADPQEYWEAMASAVQRLAAANPAIAKNTVAMAVDGTSSTVVPTDAKGRPMCAMGPWRQNPHAYAKLWKSHSADKETQRIASLGRHKAMPFMARCGHQVSSEWLYPKALETLWDAQELYHATAYFVDMPDWINWQLTGKLTRGYGAHAIKGFGEDGALPPLSFWKQIAPEFEHINEKLGGPVLRWGEPIGRLLSEIAARLGLPVQTMVAASALDAHIPMAALGMREDGDLLLSIGTSNVFALISETWVPLPGICSAAKDAFIPGFYGYDAGQAAVGDMFAWFVDNCVPARYFAQAEESGESIHTLLSRLGFAKPMEDARPIALDWWNGNRSPLCRFDVAGMINGLTLWTQPEDIYRALVEATAFGARRIVENFEQHGIGVKQIFICGGIARKNEYIMQCYADVLNRPLKVSMLSNAACVGAAITAGAALEGSGGLFAAMDALHTTDFARYHPMPQNVDAYCQQYRRYLALSDAALRVLEGE